MLRLSRCSMSSVKRFGAAIHHGKQTSGGGGESLGFPLRRQSTAAAVDPLAPSSSTSSSSGSGSSNGGGGSGPKSKAEFLGLVMGCSVFPISVYWMTREDDKTKTTVTTTHEEEATAPAFGKFTVDKVTKPQLGGPFQLISSLTGKEVSDQDVFRGHWSLLYFGFTKCAEICPNTMKFLTEVMDASKREYGTQGSDTSGEAEKLQTVFLSIDYFRDTPPAVETFLQPFRSSPTSSSNGESKPRPIVGLCGDKAHVEEAAQQWRVYYSSYDESDEERTAREAKGIPLPELDDTYQLDHSSAIYLVGPDGKMKDFFFREIGVVPTVERLGMHYRNVYGIN